MAESDDLPPVTISISNGVWSYNPPGPWRFSSAGKLQFSLGGGYTLVGMSFVSPEAAAAGGLNKYVVRNQSSTASTLTLTDNDLSQGRFDFRFVATDVNGNTVISPDPQIINGPPG